MRLVLIAVLIAALCVALYFAVLAWERSHPADRAESERAEAERIAAHRAAVAAFRARMWALARKLYPIDALARRLRREDARYDSTPISFPRGLDDVQVVDGRTVRERRSA